MVKLLLFFLFDRKRYSTQVDDDGMWGSRRGDLCGQGGDLKAGNARASRLGARGHADCEVTAEVLHCDCVGGVEWLGGLIAFFCSSYSVFLAVNCRAAVRVSFSITG